MHFLFFISLSLALLLNQGYAFASELVPLQQCGLIAHRPTTVATAADFTQQRFIKGLTKPLVSRGIFQIFPGNKIIWETTFPIFSKVTISATGFEISTANQNDAESERFNQSQFREVSSLLLSLHSLSLATIESTSIGKKFSLQCFEEQNNEFSLVASPQDRDLSKLVKSITLVGKTAATQISIVDGRGDTTTVQLTKIREINEHTQPSK